MKRPSPLRRITGLLLLAVLVAAQPQLLCGLHCLLSEAAAPMDGAPGHPVGHPAAPMSMALCHGGSVTSHRTLPQGSLATVWIPAGPVAARPAAVRTLALVDEPSTPLSAISDTESPPPRG